MDLFLPWESFNWLLCDTVLGQGHIRLRVTSLWYTPPLQHGANSMIIARSGQKLICGQLVVFTLQLSCCNFYNRLVTYNWFSVMINIDRTCYNLIYLFKSFTTRSDIDICRFYQERRRINCASLSTAARQPGNSFNKNKNKTFKISLQGEDLLDFKFSEKFLIFHQTYSHSSVENNWWRWR